jgi:hypothetical protein
LALLSQLLRNRCPTRSGTHHDGIEFSIFRCHDAILLATGEKLGTAARASPAVRRHTRAEIWITGRHRLNVIVKEAENARGRFF